MMGCRPNLHYEGNDASLQVAFLACTTRSHAHKHAPKTVTKALPRYFPRYYPRLGKSLFNRRQNPNFQFSLGGTGVNPCICNIVIRVKAGAPSAPAAFARGGFRRCRHRDKRNWITWRPEHPARGNVYINREKRTFYR